MKAEDIPKTSDTPLEEFEFHVPRRVTLTAFLRFHGVFFGTLVVILTGMLILAARPEAPEIARLNARLADVQDGSAEITDLQRQLIETQNALKGTEAALTKNEEALREVLHIPKTGPVAPPAVDEHLDAASCRIQIKSARYSISQISSEFEADIRSLRGDLAALGATRQALDYTELDLEIAKGLRPPGSSIESKTASSYLSSAEQQIPVNPASSAASIESLGMPLPVSETELNAMAAESASLRSACEDALRAVQGRIVEAEGKIREAQDRIKSAQLQAHQLRDHPNPSGNR